MTRSDEREDHIEPDGYRPNVAIVLCNHEFHVLWARRSRHDGWQFPQGGVKRSESPEEALFRELYEEIGLLPDHVEIVGRTRGWLHYDVPSELRRRGRRRRFRGQKQVWFLLQMLGEDNDVRLDTSERPEFDAWRWVEYWTPLSGIVQFKRDVYRRALVELEPLANGLTAQPRRVAIDFRLRDVSQRA